MIGIAVTDEGIPRRQPGRGKPIPHFSDLAQLRAGNDSAGVIHNTHHTIKCILHLIDHILEYPVRHW